MATLLTGQLQFTDQLGKVAQTPNKLRDVSVVCILDLCRGAARARPDPGKDLPIHANVSDYIHEVLVSSQNGSPLRSWVSTNCSVEYTHTLGQSTTILGIPR